MYSIKEINDLSKWNQAVIDSTKLSQFLQSWEWGNFQQKLERKVWRLAVVTTKTEQIVLLALIIKHNLSLGKSYLYCPRGPLWLINDKKIDQQKKLRIYSLFIEQIKKISQQEKSIFLRNEPTQTKIKQLFINQQQVKSRQPANTSVLNLQLPKAQLLLR
ncbi:MAG: peptidoglycan bridge formation glycyltransferase FemA/FemB family protein, partial [Candidatus Aenigmarchaeota archaeon]|nr:peptidoglycan bridge formation glycyltransferase FemA/FemB family protein [Candidatus Aenigmarchaeota archaeon]